MADLDQAANNVWKFLFGTDESRMPIEDAWRLHKWNRKAQRMGWEVDPGDLARVEVSVNLHDASHRLLKD